MILSQKEDYILSFWAQGINVFITDIHKDVYFDLEVLFIIDHGIFKQYFTKQAYERALDRGLKFYSEESAFKNYQKNLKDHCKFFQEFFDQKIKEQNEMSKEVAQKIFYQYN